MLRPTKKNVVVLVVIRDLLYKLFFKLDWRKYRGGGGGGGSAAKFRKTDIGQYISVFVHVHYTIFMLAIFTLRLYIFFKKK